MNSGHRGTLLVLSAPSGTGKSTVCSLVRAHAPEVAVSISHTTRHPRGQEKNGVEYFFVGPVEFDELIVRGAFLEWARVHGQRYGTSRAEVDRLLGEGRDVLLDIDIQGGYQIQKVVPSARLVLLLPPTLSQLLARLRGRGTDTQEEVRRRMRVALEELNQGQAYEFHVINDDLENAARKVNAIRCGRPESPLRQDAHIGRLIAESRDLEGVL